MPSHLVGSGGTPSRLIASLTCCLVDLLTSKQNLKGQAQPTGTAAGVGADAVADRRSTVPRIVEEAAATIHTEKTSVRAFRIGLRTTGVSTTPVVAILPYIATHIVDAQLVGRFRCHRVSFSPRVTAVPSHIVNVITTAVFIATAIVATTAGELPFSLGGEAEVLTGQGI